MPSQERFRRDEGLQFMKHVPAQFLGLDRQAPTLIVVQTQPHASELFPQHAVFLLQVIDHVALVLVQAAGHGNQQQSKGIQGQAYWASVARRSGL